MGLFATSANHILYELPQRAFWAVLPGALPALKACGATSLNLHSPSCLGQHTIFSV